METAKQAQAVYAELYALTASSTLASTVFYNEVIQPRDIAATNIQRFFSRKLKEKAANANSLPDLEQLIEACEGFDKAIHIFNKLKVEIASELEMQLHALEKEIKNNNFKIIERFAQLYGEKFIRNPNIIKIQSEKTACFVRYIVVPFLYKVGLTKAASDLNQETFAYLLPLVDKAISEKLKLLFGENFSENFDEIKKTFSPSSKQNIKFYCRIKSHQSIWKKYIASNYSTDDFLKFDLLEFTKVVDDFIALRWCVSVKPQNSENRYDATIRGVREIPKKGLYHLRNQHLVQQSGFSSEPVIKLLYIFNNIPIEVQILGGQIELYMCAKGYTRYKTELENLPTEASMTQETWNARLGTCIFLQESEQTHEFHQFMLREISDEKAIEYDVNHTYLPEKVPNLDENRLFTLENKVIYQIPNINICNVEVLITETNNGYSSCYQH